MTRQPDFVVLGQGKAGTSLIYRVFERHPDVGLSRPKELNFFTQHHAKGLAWYQSHFAHIEPDTACIGEVSPAYLSGSAITRLHTMLGSEPRLTFVLRRPIEQAYSRYLQNICAKRGRSPAKFDTGGGLLRKRLGQLHTGLQELYRRFDHDKILPLFFEQDINVERPLFETKICNFLGLTPSNHMALLRKRGKVNPSVMPRFLYGGQEGMALQFDGQAYRIPPLQLVFCAQPRNSLSHANVLQKRAAAAEARQAAWTTVITEDQFARLQHDVVDPYADKFEQDFGLDLSHWRGAARRIAYDLAPPPPEFLAEGSA